MIKKDIVEEIAGKTGLNKSIIKEITDKFLLILYKSLVDGKRVELRGFGVFEVKRVKGKKARNPKTGEAVFVPERDKVVFKVSKLYKKGGEKNGLF